MEKFSCLERVSERVFNALHMALKTILYDIPFQH
jgi:hypothetical protein